MKKNDYKVLNQKYSISQLRACQEYLAMIYADADLKENMQNGVKYLLDSIDIDKAEGVFLDYIGWLVGTSRGYFDTGAYFKINSPDVNTEKYIWFSQPETDFIAPTGSLEDRNFRARIKAKAGCNISKCTREDNINVIKNMTFANEVIIKNVAPLELDITIRGANLFVSQDLKSDIESVLGEGVGIRNLRVENTNGN